MSTEEIALLIQHMFNDEWEEPEPNYSLDSFTYTLSLTTDDDEKEP